MLNYYIKSYFQVLCLKADSSRKGGTLCKAAVGWDTSSCVDSLQLVTSLILFFFFFFSSKLTYFRQCRRFLCVWIVIRGPFFFSKSAKMYSCVEDGRGIWMRVVTQMPTYYMLSSEQVFRI